MHLYPYNVHAATQAGRILAFSVNAADGEAAMAIVRERESERLDPLREIRGYLLYDSLYDCADELEGGLFPQYDCIDLTDALAALEESLTRRLQDASSAAGSDRDDLPRRTCTPTEMNAFRADWVEGPLFDFMESTGLDPETDGIATGAADMIGDLLHLVRRECGDDAVESTIQRALDHYTEEIAEAREETPIACR